MMQSDHLLEARHVASLPVHHIYRLISAYMLKLPARRLLTHMKPVRPILDDSRAFGRELAKI